MNKHTPTPWHVGELAPTIVYGPKGEQLADLLDGSLDAYKILANAAFIVRACNAHEQLIEFLFDAIPYIEEGEQFNKPSGKGLSKQIRKFLTDLGELKGAT